MKKEDDTGVTTLFEMLSDLDKINYINHVFPEDPNIESLSYGEIKSEFKKSIESLDKPVQTDEELIKITDELDISKEMALLERWAESQKG